MKSYYLFASLFILSCNQASTKSDAYGNFEAEEITISSQSNGPIISMKVEEGDFVEQGQILATIDTLQMHFQKEQILAQMSANLARRNSTLSQINVIDEQLEIARKEQNRLKSLFLDGATTQKNLDDVEGQISVLQKQKEQITSTVAMVDAERLAQKAQLNQIQDALNRAVVKSPIRGTIITQLAEEGELALPGKPLLILANTETMTLRAYIGAEDLQQVERGQTVTVLIDKNKTEFVEKMGIITWVSPKAEFTPKIIQTKTERTNLVYAIKVSVKNDGHLLIGMPGEIVINKDVVAVDQ